MNRFTLSYWKCTSSEHAYMSCVQEQCKNWYLRSSIEYILDDVIDLECITVSIIALAT